MRTPCLPESGDLAGNSLAAIIIILNAIIFVDTCMMMWMIIQDEGV